MTQAELTCSGAYSIRRIPSTTADFSKLAGLEAAISPWTEDRDWTRAWPLDVRALDQAVIIDRRGRVACRDYGRASPDQLQRVVDQLLQGER